MSAKSFRQAPSAALEPVKSPYRVPFDGGFRVKRAETQPPEEMRNKKKKHREALAESIERMRELQHAMYAHDRYSLLLVFQAMDAAGKDGTIRHIMSGVNPAGCQVWSFKQPSAEELDHDFLWRIAQRAPERGRIGIFNRSHYEEVLAVRVHPEYLEAQKLPATTSLDDLWSERFDSIRGFERHLAASGTVILKFWLNVSRDAQRDRLLARIDEPESRGKFEKGDIAERALWDDYMAAYEDALNETSRPWAPWYAIPADDKRYMRRVGADIVVRTMERMDPSFPAVTAEQEREMLALRDELLAE